MTILDYILFHLTMKEIEIYHSRRFKKKTFEEIAKEYNVTRERIRQIEGKVTETIRNLGLDISVDFVKVNDK